MPWDASGRNRTHAVLVRVTEPRFRLSPIRLWMLPLIYTTSNYESNDKQSKRSEFKQSQPDAIKRLIKAQTVKLA